MAGAQRSILLRARVLLSAVERVQGVLCKAIGPGFVLLGMSLVLGVAYVCLIYSPLIPSDVAAWKKFSLYGFGIWIAFNILFNWSMCIITDPGTSPDTGLGTVEDVIVSESRDGNFVTNRRVIPPTDSVPSRSSKQPTFRPCRKCDKPKPPRAHHCSICDRCVLMMDHHCPWVNNCVGFRNYRFFVLFLFYMFAGCAYVSIVTMVYYPVLEKIGISQKLDLVGDDDGGMRLPVSREIGLNSALMFTFLLTSAVGVAVSLLLGFHIFLILTAQTTIEFHTNKLKASHFRHEGKIFINDYDLGKSRNWEQVFGKHRYPLAWLLPSTKPPKGDGVNWPTCKSIIYEDAAHIV